MVPVHVTGVVNPTTLAETVTGVPFCPVVLNVLRLVVGETDRKLLQFVDDADGVNVIGAPVLEAVIVCDRGACWPIWKFIVTCDGFATSVAVFAMFSVTGTVMEGFPAAVELSTMLFTYVFGP